MAERFFDFTVTGTIRVPADAETIFDAFGNEVGWELSDGTHVKLQAALDVDKKGVFTIASNDQEMEELGMNIFEYHEASITEHGE